MIQSLVSKIKNNKSIFYYVSFVFIIIMYFIFFNAYSILPDDSPIINTGLGQEVDIGSTKLYINRCEYNKDKNFMEIELNYNDSGDSLESKLDFSAKAKVNIKKKLNIETMVTTDNTYIIHIENIPENYEAIALKVSQNSDINTDTNNIVTDDFSANSNDNNSTTLYFDYRKVKINNNIKVETQKYYLVNITKAEINNIENNMAAINNKIKNNQNLINLANIKINSLKGQYKYEVEEEQNNTTQEISSYKAKINDSNQQNSDLQNTKSSLEEKVKKLEQKVNDITKK